MSLETEFAEKRNPSQSTETPNNEHHHLSLYSIVKGIDKNVIEPALDGAACEPFNAAANGLNQLSELGTDTINKVTGSHLNALQVPKIEERASDAAPGSLAELSQRVAHAGGALIGYAIAARVAGKGLNCVSEALPLNMQLGRVDLSSMSRAFLEDSRVAMTVGGTGLEALRDTKAGETHLSNAASALVGFSTFALGNKYFVESGASKLSQASQRFTVGALTGIVQANTSSLIADHKFADKDATADTMLSSGILNAVLPALHRSETIAIDDPFVKPMEKSYFERTLSKVELEKPLANSPKVVEPPVAGYPSRAEQLRYLDRPVQEALSAAENNHGVAANPDAMIRVNDEAGATRYQASRGDLQKLLKLGETNPEYACRLHKELYLGNLQAESRSDELLKYGALATLAGGVGAAIYRVQRKAEK